MGFSPWGSVCTLDAVARTLSAGQRPAVGVRATPEFSRKAASPRFFVLATFIVLFAPAQAEVGWRGVRGAYLHALFVDHELADGVHYAYQFRSDGTFTGFNMGKAIRGTWRIAGDEFCWTQARRRSRRSARRERQRRCLPAVSIGACLRRLAP